MKCFEVVCHSQAVVSKWFSDTWSFGFTLTRFFTFPGPVFCRALIGTSAEEASLDWYKPGSFLRPVLWPVPLIAWRMTCLPGPARLLACPARSGSDLDCVLIPGLSHLVFQKLQNSEFRWLPEFEEQRSPYFQHSRASWLIFQNPQDRVHTEYSLSSGKKVIFYLLPFFSNQR